MRKAMTVFLILLAGTAGFSYLKANTAVAPQNISAAVIKAGDERLYPNPRFTPGDTLTADASVVCQPTYYRSVKDVSEDVKKTVYKKYGLRYPQAEGKYEIDRLVPIELGGSNQVKNLWPQAAKPTPGFKQKNAVDNFLHAQVCTNQMTLREAQQKVMTDWYAVYLSISK